MDSHDIRQLQQSLEEQKRQVQESPEAARQLLEELGLWDLMKDTNEESDTPSVRPR